MTVQQLSMVHFLWPWAFAALPLPVLLHYLLPRAKQTSEAALRVPYIEDFELGSGETTAGRTRRWPLLLYTLAWCCLVIASARPQWVGSPIELPISGRDLMIAVDLSKSMEEPFRYMNRSVSRLAATKAVISQFIEHRVGDRIGLILFGGQAYVQAPLTFDRTTVRKLLMEAVTGLAGNTTAIGTAIGLAVKRLVEDEKAASLNRQPGQNQTAFAKEHHDKKHPYNDRVLILVTDGVNNAGEITPIKAAELAAREGLKIYTIGIGNPGSRELDEYTLRAIARITGGRYFRARNTAELVRIYRLLDKLEPVKKDTQSYLPTKALFYLPLTAAFIIAALLALLLKLPVLFTRLRPYK